MTTYGMIIDVNRCTGCYNCFLACRDEHVGNDHGPIASSQPESGHRWIDVLEHERGKIPRVRLDHVPLPCQLISKLQIIFISLLIYNWDRFLSPEEMLFI